MKMNDVIKKIIVNTVAIVLCVAVWIGVIALVEFSNLGEFWKFLTIGFIISLWKVIWVYRRFLCKWLG